MKVFVVLFFSLFLLSCKSSEYSEIYCSDEVYEGEYFGREFINGADIAHQFSNKMAEKVGLKLKELYKVGKYRKVNLNGISMKTEGMGSGKVNYKLIIPFSQVRIKCEALTSFDHVGGWGHKPELNRRKKELQKFLMSGHSLEISNIKKTPVGLQEYWIQWKNKDIQKECQ